MIDVEILLRRLDREKKARREAETIAEEKSLELYVNNQELSASLEIISNNEKYIRSILEASADGIIVLDKDNKIIICNQTMYKLLDYSIDELNNINITTLIENIGNQSSNKDSKPEANQQQKGIFETILIRKNKTIVPIEISFSSLNMNNGTMFIYSIRDISERKKSERRIALHHEITRILAEHLPQDEAIIKILKIICDILQLQVGEFWIFNNEDNVLHCRFIWNVDDPMIKEFAESANKTTLLPGQGLPGITYMEKKVYWIEDLSNNPEFYRFDLAKIAGLRCGFSFPIIFENRVLGVFTFFSINHHTFDDLFIDMLYDVSRQIGIFIDREQTQKKMEVLSRQAGMSEVATSILHNIGNVLNSVKVSTTLIQEKFHNKYFKNFSSVVGMLKEHEKSLSHFLIEDEKGKLIPTYLITLIDFLSISYKDISNELHILINHIKHIEDVVAMQKSISGASRVVEKIFLPDVVDDAIRLCRSSLQNRSIEIHKEFKDMPFLMTDKSKVIQILVNLIQNAKDALSSKEFQVKKINIIVEIQKSTSNVDIVVSDNGIGIDSENMNKIFSMGFTTKPGGHGFGLHSSALAAKEIGGILLAKSEGLNTGTTFTLSIPLSSSGKKDHI